MMVIPSSSVTALSSPHIGSAGRGGTFFGAIPESQWPAFPTQQGIEAALAPAIGSSGATNDKATKRQRRYRLILKHRVCLLCCFVTMNLLFRLVRQRFPDQFHFALWTRTALLGGHIVMHGTYIMVLNNLFRVSRVSLSLSSCVDDADRIQAQHEQGQCQKW